LLQPLAPGQLSDASTLFNTWQRVAGSFGIGLIGALAAVALPAGRNDALSRG
jgi:hypothetical protein